MKRNLLLIITLTVVILMLPACGDSFDNAVDDEWSIMVESESDLIFETRGRYHSFKMRQEGIQDSTLMLTADADWLTLATDILPHDGIVSLLTETNEKPVERTAVIYIVSASHPERKTTVQVRQIGKGGLVMAGDDADNDFHVGYGFNVFNEYKSCNSVYSRIIDTNKLQDFDAPNKFLSVQEAARAVDNFEFFCAYSMQEMQSILTKSMHSATNILGVKYTVERFKKVNNNSINESLYGYARMTRTVATRSIDAGVLHYLVNDANLTIDNLPFTNDFLNIYRKICTDTQNREKNIETMVNNYGTHLVIEASLGGMIDYVVTFDRNVSQSLQTMMETHSLYVFGRKAASDKTDDEIRHVSSSINNDYSFKIAGGTQNAQDAIKYAITNMKKGDQLPTNLIGEWMENITAEARNSYETRDNLAVVDFQFIPIWELFADANVRHAVQQHFMAMQSKSDCSFTDQELGTDNYAFENIAQYDNFSTEDNASLVKVVYDKKSGEPLMEVCNEYVPKIRGDKRITVYYPIKNGSVRHGQGIFRGDGEGNKPAMLTFSDGDVYVYPLENYGYKEQVNTLYYLHGNLYTEDFGTQLKSLEKKETREQYLELSRKYPFVKIGSGYWTRGVVGEDLNLVNCYYCNNVTFLNPNTASIKISSFTYKEVFSNDKDDKGQYTKWWCPSSSDIENLHNYVGKNSKSLFKGQISGFNAVFSGYMGQVDIFTGERLPIWSETDNKNPIVYYSGYCIIPAVDKDNYLIIDSNYHLQILGKKGYIIGPLKPFRTGAYKYENIKDD